METHTAVAQEGGLWTDRASTLLVCFSAWENGVVCGELWSFYEQQPRLFRGLDQLLFNVEAALDEAGQQAAWFSPREAVPSRRVHSSTPPLHPCHMPADLLQKRGGLATASVRVYYRRNASFQGELRLYDPARTLCFRSALELIHLLWSELDEKSSSVQK